MGLSGLRLWCRMARLCSDCRVEHARPYCLEIAASHWKGRACSTPTTAGLERDSERQIADGRPTVDQLMLREVRMEEIRQAIAELPDRQRAAVIMHKYEELEYTQIAVALNCSPQTVKSLLFRAYNTLRVRLAHMVAA